MKSLYDRFWSKVKKEPNKNGCWLWTDALGGSGYGRIGVDGKVLKAHRFSWLLHFGKIPNKLCVLHKCDVRNCVNPNHLFLGTRADNSKDKVHKGRQCKHENIGVAKLTREKVNKIRSLYQKENITQTALGKRFGISQNQISNIVRGLHWKGF